MNDTIGNRIKNLREQYELSQGQISIKTKKSRSLVALWEQDKRMIKNNFVYKQRKSVQVLYLWLKRYFSKWWSHIF